MAVVKVVFDTWVRDDFGGTAVDATGAFAEGDFPDYFDFNGFGEVFVYFWVVVDFFVELWIWGRVGLFGIAVCVGGTIVVDYGFDILVGSDCAICAGCTVCIGGGIVGSIFCVGSDCEGGYSTGGVSGFLLLESGGDTGRIVSRGVNGWCVATYDEVDVDWAGIVDRCRVGSGANQSI